MSLKNLLRYKIKARISCGSIRFNFNRSTSIFIILILLMPITLSAQKTITLSQAITNGLANKKNITAGKMDETINKLQTQALYRKYWPQVSAEYNYLYNPILQTSILPIGIFNPAYPADATKSVQFGTKWTQSAGITATQPLIDLSSQRNINEAKLKEQITTQSQEFSQYELAYSIAQTYIDICLQTSKIKAAITDTNRTYISYNLLKNKFEENQLLKSDLNKSKINHNNSVQQLANEIHQLVEDKVYLLFLMGENDTEKSNFEIDTSFVMNDPFINLENQLAFNELPDIQQLALQSKLKALQTRSEKVKHLPTVSFKGFIGGNQFSNTFDPVAPNTWFGLSYVGLNAKLPLLFGENQQNKLQELQLQSQQYSLEIEDKTAEYTKDILIAKLKIGNIKTQLRTQEENLALHQESIRIFQARVLEGQEAASTLNSEEADFQTMKADYETNKKQLWTYWLNYLKSSGLLSIFLH